jgi:ATP-dependent Clp protease protease subunit
MAEAGKRLGDEESESPETISSELRSRLLEHRIIYLNRDVSFGSDIVPVMHLLDWEDSRAPISLWISSLGGDVYGCMAIYDAIHAVKAPVQTVCWGFAASSAAMILSAGTPGMRIAMPNSFVMIHQIQIDTLSGTGTEIEIEAKEIKRLKNHLSEILARHCHQPLAKVKRDCDHDKYLDAQGAKEYGIVDVVASSMKDIPALRTRSRRRKPANNPA